MSHTVRKGERPDPRQRRRDRYFQLNGGWYITTRGAVYVGPFPTRQAAESAVKQLTELLIDVDDPKVAEAFVREFGRRADKSRLTGQDGAPQLSRSTATGSS
jgi:hypothetical protein